MPDQTTAPTTFDPRTQDDRIRIGASWYPELWPEAEWPKDTARMKELGFNVVRLFEFAWKRFEPSEGVYDFDWALRVMDHCHEAGVGVMVGTPTAAPPAWLTTAYPEVLQTRPDGTVRRHGMRKHYAHTSRKYRELCGTIVEKMAEAFSGHPALHSWQIDNEMSGRDFSDRTKTLFHDYLRDRFGTIEALNEAWCLNFWSQAYDDFSQIPMPTAGVGSIEVPERHHPSLILAIAQFFSSEWTRFIAHQCDIIREQSDKPITTNMCGFALGSDWFDHNKPLDRVGHSKYNDVEHYPWTVMIFDRMRGEKPGRPYWLLETAPNWSGGGKQWNIHHNQTGLRAFNWLNVMLGGSMTLYWQWRGHPAGQEMQHGTCVDATGRWRPNKAMWTQLSTEFADQSEFLLGHPPKTAEMGVVLDTHAAWAFSIDPIDNDMQYAANWRDRYFQPLVQEHLWRDVTDLTNDWERYKVLCIPHVPVLPEAVKQRLLAWVKAGGRLLLGPLTGYRNEEFGAFTDTPFGGLEQLFGAETDLAFSAHWRDDAVSVRFEDGAVTGTKAWCESFTPGGGAAKAIAHYQGEGEYGHGKVAAIEHTLGEGKVITLGCMVDTAVYATLAKRLLSEIGVEPLAQGSSGIVVSPRADGEGNIVAYGLVNLSQEPGSITLPSGGTDRLTGAAVRAEVEMAPLSVMLIEVG